MKAKSQSEIKYPNFFAWKAGDQREIYFNEVFIPLLNSLDSVTTSIVIKFIFVVSLPIS